ncbi:PIN domain-containing protein [Herbaspirillum rubrisubalbicans]|uniref:PIN domain-containing protein n=1 Tax=Herbaspirillum rubrisubalbicans TaxID=80842 RepID=UPI0015EBC60A|nr:tetratricopeptide repeat protein [Herbaspirillum rubrisubalbicans]
MIDSIGWMLVVARMQKEPTADFSLITKDFIAASQNKLAATCRVFENASHRNMADVSKIYAQQVIQLYEEILDPNYLLFAVDALLTLERNEDALSLLSKNIDLTSPQGGPLEERMAFCLLRLQRFETLTKLLEGISPQASYSSRFDFYRIDLHLSRGDYSAALAAIRTALSTRPNNLRLQSLEVALLLDEGNNADARQKFEAISFDAESPAEAIKLYIHQASRLSENRKADEIAYRWIRENGNDPDNAAWFLGNFLLNKRPQESNEQLRSVTKQCGVLISSKSHPDQSRWIVVDDRFDERVSDGWYTSRSSQIPNLIGSTLGSVIDISAFPGGPFKIERIVPIFEGAFYLIQSRYGKEIPMAPFLYYISLKGEGEEYDFSSIFKMLDDSKDATINALSVYSKSPIPLAILAHAIHRHPIDMWMALTGGQHSVRAMSGDTATVSRMIEQLDQTPLSLILDPIVVVSWHYFGVLQLIPSISKSLFMSISAVDLIRQKRNELDSKEGKSRSTLSASHENGKYTHTEITAEEITREKETFDQILTWINTHVRLKPVPTEGIAEEHYSRMRREWPSYLADSFQLSANENGTLIADDLGIEVLAASVGIRQAPTAILFRYGLQKKLVEHVDVSRVLYQLAKANYDFVSLRPEYLLPLTDIQNIGPAPEIVTLLRYLQSPSLDVRSGLLFVCRYAKILDDLNASTSLICASITISMSSISRHATRETIRSFATFYIFAERFLSPQSCASVKDSLNQWWRGHFLSAEDLKK